MGAAGQVQGCSQGNNSHLSDNSHLTDLFKDQSFPILSDIATQRWYIVPHTMEPNHRISGGIASQVVLMDVESKLVSFFFTENSFCTRKTRQYSQMFHPVKSFGEISTDSGCKNLHSNQLWCWLSDLSTTYAHSSPFSLQFPLGYTNVNYKICGSSA